MSDNMVKDPFCLHINTFINQYPAIDLVHSFQRRPSLAFVPLSCIICIWRRPYNNWISDTKLSTYKSSLLLLRHTMLNTKKFKSQLPPFNTINIMFQKISDFFLIFAFHIMTIKIELLFRTTSVTIDDDT